MCAHHGGKVPGVQLAAKRRLLAMVEPALDALLRALQMGSPCQHCGRSDNMAVVVKAAQIVLDRTGFHPSMTLEVGPAKGPTWERFVTDEELGQIAQITARAKQRMLTGRLPDSVDAVLVEDVPTPNQAEPGPLGNEPGPGEVDG